MSLRDLKNLAPWQWESKIAQRKHAIGPKGIADFEQVARVLKIRSTCLDATDSKDKQLSNTKRRRASKENEEPANSNDVKGALSGAATPAVPSKQQRPPTATPTDVTFKSSSKQPSIILAASEQPGDAPQETAVAAVEKGLKLDSSPCTFDAKLTGTPGLALLETPAPAVGKFNKADQCAAPAATSAAPSWQRSSRDRSYRCSSPKDASGYQKSAKIGLSPACLTTPAGQTLQPQSIRASSITAAAATRMPGSAAARTPASLNPKNLLADIFSPSPLPTPMPCAKLGFKTPHSAAQPQLGSAKFGGSTAAAGGGPDVSSRVTSISNTPVPRPHFTPKMPPPASRRTSCSGTGLGMQQQTPSRPASTKGPAGSSSGRVLQSPAGLTQTPLSCLEIPAVGDETMNNSSPGLIRVQDFTSPNHSQALAAVQSTGRGSSSSSTPPAPALLLATAGPTAAKAAVAAEGQEPSVDGSNRHTSPPAAAAVGSSACLPAKLRCKKAGFSSSPEPYGHRGTPLTAETATQPRQLNDSRPAGPHAATTTGYTTPVCRVGLKRRWCQNHAAAMAAEAGAARSPDSLAVARSADLLLAAAAAEDMDYDEGRTDLAIPDNMDQERSAAANNEEDQPAAAAVITAMQVDLDKAARQEARQAIQQPQEPLAAEAPAALWHDSRQNSCREQQDGTCNSIDSEDAAQAAVAANAAPGASCGTSLLLPPAAQARLQMIQLQEPAPKQQQQIEACQQQRLHAGTAAAAAVGRTVQYGVPYMYCLDATALSGSVKHEQNQQLSHLQQLQQQQLAAATATGRVPHAPSAAQTPMTRTFHSSMAAHSATTVHAHTPGLPRVAHGSTAAAAAAAATITQLGVWNGRLLLLQAHQQQLQQQRRSTSPANVALELPAAAAENKMATAAKAESGAPAPTTAGTAVSVTSSGSSVQQVAVGRGPTVTAVLAAAHQQAAATVTPTIAFAAAAVGAQKPASNSSSTCDTGARQTLEVAPLSVPGTLSDTEAWKLAQSQPWVIELEAARARQLLAHAAAASTGVGAAGGC